MDTLLATWRGWRLKNTAFFILGLIIFFYLSQTPAVESFITHLGFYGRLGALLAGFFFVSTYTVVPAGFVLFELAKYSNPLEVAIFAGIGSMIGDYVIFRFVRDRVMDELKPYLSKVGTPKVRRLFRTPYFAWLLPVTGAIIIASPLPDELGVSLIGASKMSNAHFLLFSYALNVLGILAIVALAGGMN